jgi:TrpR-related protein YerC/YecD
MNRNLDENLELLFKSILTLENIDDCINFFEDLCTTSELQEMSRRIKAAKMLSEGIVYSEIAAQTGLSTATISRVNHCLKYGSEGYLKALKRVKIEDKRSFK